jgi:hypothetical protein
METGRTVFEERVEKEGEVAEGNGSMEQKENQSLFVEFTGELQEESHEIIEELKDCGEVNESR